MAVLKPRDGQNPKWVRCDLSEIFENESLQKHLDDLSSQQELEFVEDKSAPPPYDFPDIGANRLQPAALKHLCTELSGYMERAVAPVSDFPAYMILERREFVWARVIEACLHQFYSEGSLRRAIAALKKEKEEGEGKKSKEASKTRDSTEKLSGNDVLIEVGVRTGMSIVFSLLKQAWAQFTWQKQLEQQLQLSGATLPLPGGQLNLPNQVLRSVLDVLKGIPPLSLANVKALSKLSSSCLEQASEFLNWIVQSTSFVDAEGKRLASEILLSLALQHGNLNSLLEWLGNVLCCLTSYKAEAAESDGSSGDHTSYPHLSLEFCLGVLEEIRKRTVGTLIETIEHKPFEPKEVTSDGNISLLEFALFLCQELSEICRSCTQYFSRGNSDSEDRFLSETCEVYAFGSNSSSQLAMGSTEKLPKATPMAHMANCQVVEAGQYCSFLLFGDGTMKACGKGSYGRLGLGNSDSQSSLRAVTTFPSGTALRKLASSRGSDGHTMAITTQGQVYSWGDGNYGKLGHGDNTTHKVPKLIAAFEGKAIRHVACGNRHSAAVTVDGELYTWGEGDYGRLGHGTTTTVKTPTRVEAIGPVRQVACGAAHTLALAMDGLTVYSFGSGDSGKLGHGDTNKQTTPKVVEGLRGMLCQKVCATSQFSLALTAAGKVYSWGNGSGVGKGTTEPRQYTPWLIEALEGEMVIDVATGDGHCLALTQRGEVYAWGTNSMGQCGQGHSNGSITTPTKVQGLDGVQVQQISAGTSHSIVWTAVPIDRRASAMWHWPYCVNVGEKTFKHLLDLLNQYGSLSGDQPPPPFDSREMQEQFVFSLLSLVRTHLSLAAPLGPSCVHMACGAQVKPLRTFLFKLIDSQLPPALDQVTSESLEVGSSVLLPPVLDRLELLLSILPEDPSHLSSLTVGQHRQLDLLLMGFVERGEFAGVLVDEALLDQVDEFHWVCTPYVTKLFTLCDRMVDYLHEATMASLDSNSDSANAAPPDLQPDSTLLQSFCSFLLSVYLNVVTFMQSQMEWVDDLSEQLDLPYHDKLCVMTHFEPFYNILKHHTITILMAIAERAREAEDPVAFLESKQGAIFSFLTHDMPSHIALTVSCVPAFDAAFGLGELLVEVGHAVHRLVALLPPTVVEGFEREELNWEPINVKPEKIEVTKLRAADPQPWRKLIDLERTCCWAAGRCTRFLYTSIGVWREDSVLEYSPGKGKPSLLSSHLLSNGTVGDAEETAEAIHTWVSLCKALPFPQPEGDETPPPDGEKEHWANFIADYNALRKKSDRLSHTHLDLLWEPTEIQPCDPASPSTSPLLALAVGARGNAHAELLYDNMMELAKHKDWNTCSDESSLPELRQVSCAALACLLKHTGLFRYASSCGVKPKKKLVDIYRAVFSLRREVFTNRPIPDSEGKLAPTALKEFASTCNGICATLFFFACVLSPALPEESEPIVPQIATSASNGSSASTDDVAIRSPGARIGPGTQRLFSHPEIRDDSSPIPPKEPTISHSTSHAPQAVLEEQQGWSLSAVKQALSHLRWQKDRLDMHATTSTGAEGCLHQKIAGMVVDIVSQAFLREKESLSRRSLLCALMTQQTRAELRRNALKKMLHFLVEGKERKDLLPSSKLIYLSDCLKHNVHYSEHIEAAPSILQHEIKSLSHSLLEEIVSSIHQISPEQLTGPSSQIGVHRDLLLALQWTNFSHEPSDLFLLFSGELYTKAAVLSGVVSSQTLGDTPLSSTRLASRLRQACVLVTQLLALRVGMNAEVLKTRPDILAAVSKHLYGQLEGYVYASLDPRLARQWEAHECDIGERETLLGEFLCFLNTLSATHPAIRSVFASDAWFGTLLRIVDIDISTGVPKVVSLKTRLLALQVLGAIMAELADTGAEAQVKCSKIIEDLLELMYRCMFLAPVSSFQNVQPSHPLEHGQIVDLPFIFDSTHQHSCTITAQGEGALIEGSGGRGYALGQQALNSGKYTWKVTVESDNAAFCVGVAQKPLTNQQVGSSAQFWALESHTGRLYHEGESNELLFNVSEGDSVEVEYDSVAKTLSFGKNSSALTTAYHNVARPTQDLYPMVLFTRRHNTTKVRFHPISYCSQSPLSHLKRREQLTSGYPMLSPTGVTLAQALINTLHNLQDKEPWSRAITQVLCSKLSEMDTLIHRLLDIKTELEGLGGGIDSSHSILPPLSVLISKFTQVVWPCLAVVGGLDSGVCLGRECQMDVKGEPQIVTLVSVPDSDRKVEVQNQVTATTATVKKRSTSLSELRLLAQCHFHLPLLVGQLSPSVLMNLAHLAGFLEPKHSLSTILQQAHRLTPSHPHSVTSCLPYHQLCESLLQMSATKSLHAILFNESVIQLLSYQPPPMEVVIAGGYVDKSELAQTVREVLKCLATRAIKPSPLKPTLKLLELERVHAVLGYESLAAVAEYMHVNGQLSPPNSKATVAETSPPSSPHESLTPSADDIGTEREEGRSEGGGGEGEARAATPPMMHTLLDMGFSRAQVNVALERCEIPPNTNEQSRMNLLVSWIIDHPEAVSEEEARLEQVQQDREADERQRQEEQRQREEADQVAAASEFLSLFGEMFNSQDPPRESEEGEGKRETKHAPDLLEGPDIDEEVPDVSLTGLDTSPQSLILSALGLSQKRPTPKRFQFAESDPLGENLCKVTPKREGENGSREGDSEEDDTSGDFVKVSPVCENMVQQAQKLRSLKEHLSAIGRITAATQTLVARHITMLVIASLSTRSPQSFISSLRTLDLLDVKALVRLLRLMHAGRIDGTPGKSFSLKTPSSLLPIKGLECLSSAVTTVVSESAAAGDQLMQACSRDLLAAAVGGAELLQKNPRRGGRRHRERAEREKGEKSDVSVLTNPSFSVSQSLVQTMAEATGKVMLTDNSGVLNMTDALAACLFSSKLEPEHRFWALEQLLKMFSTGRKEPMAKTRPESLVSASQLEHLTSHKGQIMACAENKREKKIVSIGEDNTLMLWNLEGTPGGQQPETRALPFPQQSSAGDSPGYLLPTLAQSFNYTCVAGAVNDVLCVWRVRDGKTVCENFPELISAFQWKPAQRDGEAPLLLVGLVSGELTLVEVLRASVNLTPEIQTTKLEHYLKGGVRCLSWSLGGSRFAVASTSGLVQVYSGAGREYSPTAEIKEVQVTSLAWSPNEALLSTLEADKTLKLWDLSGEVPSPAHTFGAYSTCCLAWHSTTDTSGRMLLASGSQDGAVHLWTVEGKASQSDSEPSTTDQSESSIRVSHVTALQGHQAPVTVLEFSETAVLLASGCKAGSVRVWDLKSLSLLKLATRAVGEVLHLGWTSHGLAVCYRNTGTLCLLPPGPSDYLGERCLHTCLPTLHLHNISEPDKAPCLSALLRNLHYLLQDQYQYEEGEVSSAQQLVHSQYLQLITALTVGLGLHNILVTPPHPPHFDPPPPAKEWQWLSNFTMAIKMSEALNKRSALPQDCGFQLPKDVQPLDPTEKHQTTDNSAWSLTMDSQILEWVNQQPEQWWQSSHAGVFTWGKGSWNQLGHSTREKSLPAIVEDWHDVQQIVAGSYCTYAVKFDGTVASVGEGSYGRLGHGGSESESNLRVISSLQGIPVVQVVAGPRVSTSTDEGFALALTDAGDVYSWGKGYKGRLGHSSAENCRSPKLVEALAGKDVKMLACCDYHCAAVTTGGRLYTFGSKENGKLGHGRDTPSGSVGHVTEVTKYLDADEQTELDDIKIGYVSCGQTFTIAISEDGTRVFGFGKAEHCAFGARRLTGDHYHPMLLDHLSRFGPFVKSACGYRIVALINNTGQFCWFGKLCENQGSVVEAELVAFPSEEKVSEVATAGHYILALSEGGEVYSWGKNSGNTCELGYESSSTQNIPKLIENLAGKGIKQISAGIRHAVCSDCPLPVRGVTNLAIPSSVPAEYSALKEVSCRAIHARLLLLNHFAKLMISSWRLFSTERGKTDTARFHINPLTDGCTRSLISPAHIEGMIAGVVSRTMVTKSHGPSITIQRITQDDRASRPVFPQIASLILQKPAKDLRCPSRAWKITLVGEGADDAGGVFDETIAQMCEELEQSVVKLLIPTPNAANKLGFNTDRFVFDPSCTTAKDMKHFKFLGILFGVAMRTKKPLDLHLAQAMWKLLAGMSLTQEDLEEVDLMFMQTLYGIRDIHKSGIKEEDFSEMIPIESFEAQSMNGKFVPIIPGGSNIKLTFHNRKEYVEKALHFRLHELDQQVAAVREGMASIVPVPLLSLCTAKRLETAVCGSEEVDILMLKKVVRYRDGISENDQLVQWLWQTLESYTNEEKILFLRFVSGRSRLPTRVSEIPQRFQVMKWGQSTDGLPTSQTCFFQIRLPTYSSQEVMAERLRYAIRNCRSIDMDNYMLRRNNSGEPYYDSDDDDYD